MPTDSTVEDLDALIRASEAVRKPYEAQVFLNMAMFIGDQWVAWDGTQLFEPSLEDWRAKVVDNRIAPTIRTEIAKMTKTQPTWVGVPKSQADEDVSAARYAEFAMQDAWKRHDLHRKLRAALLWARVATCGYWKVWWDSTAGKNVDVIVNRETRKAARDGYGKPIKDIRQLPEEVREGYEPKTVSMGEVCVDLRNFFQVYPDPHATEEGLSSCEYIGEKAVFTRDYIARHFPEHAEQLSYDSKPSAGVGKGRYAFSRFAGQTAEANEKQVAGVELCEYWSEHKHVIWSPKSQILLLEEDNPYPFKPYVMWRGQPAPGQFYPDCTTTQLVPRQVSLNKVLSQIEENAERIGNPPFMRPSTMDDDEYSWNGEPGEEVVYVDTGTPGAMPSFMQVPELPAYVQNLPGTIVDSLREIAGQHEVSSGQVPAGVTAASAIQLLQEQDDTRLGPDIAEMTTALSEAGQMVLWLMGKYYTDERHLRVSGDDGQWDVLAFKGSFLKGHTEVEAQTGSGLPMSKAAKQAAIQSMLNLFLQNGVQIPERSLRKVLSQFEVGGLEQFFATQERDTRQVQEENRKMALPGAQPLPINAYDNDEVHIAEHEDFQKTSRYYLLPDPNKALFEAHVAAHRERATPPPLVDPATGAPMGPPAPSPDAAAPPVMPMQSSGLTNGAASPVPQPSGP